MLSLESGGPSGRPGAGRDRGPLGLDLLGLDPLALMAVGVLSAAAALNLVAIGRPDSALHQLAAVLVGLALLAGLRRVSVGRLPWVGRLAYAGALALLLAVVVAGASANGARRWLLLGSVVVQPSELAKLGLLLVMADVLGRTPLSTRRIALALGLAAPPVALTLLQPDLSTALLLALVAAAVLLAARVPFSVLVPLMVGAASLTPVLSRLLRPYQAARLHAFLSGNQDAGGAGWSQLQAHIAIASGGAFGVARDPVHLLLAEYLPARETDLAFASLVEQWGFAAGAAVLLAALVLVWRLVAVGRQSRTPGAGLVAAGLAVLVGAEAVISLAGNLGALPLAGVPFPFLSYGGTAAIAHLAALGLILGARRDALRRPLWMPPRPRRAHPRLARLVALGLTAQVVGLAAFGWHLEEVHGASLRQLGKAEMTRCLRLPAPRGTITDRHGTPLAVNAPFDRVLAFPTLLAGDSEAVGRLAALMATSPEVLRQELGKPTRDLAVRLGEVPTSVGDRITAANLRGVVVTSSPRRVYPYGPLLAPLLGFVGVATPEDMRRLPDLPLGAMVGRAGLERQYDSFLRGTDGYQCVLVDPLGHPVALGERKEPVPGDDLRLSLDLGLQQMVTARLAAAARGLEAAAVVLDARTGEVLAMASLPSYDDNLFGPPVDSRALEAVLHQRGNPMLEHATQVAAPPGSTFKLVVAAADTVHGAIPPEQVIPTGYTFSLGNQTFHGWGYLPPQNLVQAIAWSNDVYFYKLALALGPERIAEVGSQLGVGKPTGIDLPGENPGFLGTPASVKELGEIWYPGSSVILGIGQGYVTATPLQVARWTGAVASGRLVVPHLALAFGPSAGPQFGIASPPPQLLSFADRLGPVREGLRLAVTQGTGTLLRDLPLPAGGKTGSAEDPGAGGAGVDAWFTAALPMADPELVVTAFVRGGGEGHQTAEPVVRDVLSYYLSRRTAILATPPTYAPSP